MCEATVSAIRDETDSLRSRVEPETDERGACIVADGRTVFLAIAGTGGGCMLVCVAEAFEAGVWPVAMVADRARGAPVGGFALHGQTNRIASMKLLASVLLWKFT